MTVLLFFQSIFYFPDYFPPFQSIPSAVPCFCAPWWNLRVWRLGATAVFFWFGCLFFVVFLFVRGFFLSFSPSNQAAFLAEWLLQPKDLQVSHYCAAMPYSGTALPSASAWTPYSVVTPRCRFLHPFSGCCLMVAVSFVSGSWDNGQVLQQHKDNKEAASLQPRRSETTLRNKPLRRCSRLQRYKSNIPDNAKCLHSPAPQMSCGSLPFTICSSLA